MAFGSTLLVAQPRSGATASGLFYEIAGEGELLVFIHAFSLDRRMWDAEVATFSDRFRVVRYDLRGHGRSAPSAEPYTGYGDLRELLDHLAIPRATLIGLSAGSELAINFALAHPDRVSRLVLAGPGLGGHRSPPLPWFGPIIEAAMAGKADEAARLWAGTPIMALKSNPAAAEAVRLQVMDNARLWTLARTEQPLTPPAVDRLGEIKIPSLVVVGSEDLPHIREIAALIATQVDHARLVTIPGAGHLVTLDAPEAFHRALRSFLE